MGSRSIPGRERLLGSLWLLFILVVGVLGLFALPVSSDMMMVGGIIVVGGVVFAGGLFRWLLTRPLHPRGRAVIRHQSGRVVWYAVNEPLSAWDRGGYTDYHNYRWYDSSGYSDPYDENWEAAADWGRGAEVDQASSWYLESTGWA